MEKGREKKRGEDIKGEREKNVYIEKKRKEIEKSVKR